jgi:hypothetical protein
MTSGTKAFVYLVAYFTAWMLERRQQTGAKKFNLLLVKNV